MALVDELQSGVPVAGAPELQLDLDVSTWALAAALLAAPAGIGVVLESAVLAWTDRVDRRPVLVAALASVAATSALMAAASGPWMLALAFGLWGTASGIATGTAEAALVAGARDASRDMTRWTFAGTLGDLVAPLLVGAVVAGGASWRLALLVTAAVPAVDAVAVALGPRLAHVVEEEEATASEALRDRRLLAWALAVVACTLMDEILVVFGALRLEALGLSPLARGAQIAALPLGGALGLALADRVLARHPPRAVLLAASAWTTAAFLAWLSTSDPVLGAVLAGLLGAGIAPLWALSMARAYALHPDRPGLVGAIVTLMTPLELAAPLLVGLVADRVGLTPALLLLLVQPLTVALVAWRQRP